VSFHDRLTINVRAGRGGDGSYSFRREAHVPRGGADGGDGGDGGDVILKVDPSRRDLAHLRRKREYNAQDGVAGARKKQNGARGDSVELSVPRGTQAFTEEGRKLCDLIGAEERAVIARGGQGGRGNTHFVSSVRRAPSFAEIGLPGEEIVVELRLKLMADAALVGFPNAGKSSLLRRISNAKPKVGDYPFTTIQPVLGTIERPDGSQLVVVDVPGLIEGASSGLGMGHAFLAHLERAHLLVHMVSLENPDDAARDFAIIADELWAYDPRIARLPQIVVLSKLDLVDEEIAALTEQSIREAATRLEDKIGTIVAVHALSSASSQGLTAFVQTLFNIGTTTVDEDASFGHTTVGMPLDDYRVYRPQPRRRRWRIYRDAQEGLRVAGDEQLQKLAKKVLEGNEADMDKLEGWLEEHGVLRALSAAGASSGHHVDVCGTRVQL
jgi:GTP-binding protein